MLYSSLLMLQLNLQLSANLIHELHTTLLINPRCACAARVTVVVLCVRFLYSVFSRFQASDESYQRLQCGKWSKTTKPFSLKLDARNIPFFFRKKLRALSCPYAEDYTNQEYRTFLEIHSSDESTYRTLPRYFSDVAVSFFKSRKVTNRFTKNGRLQPHEQPQKHLSLFVHGPP